LGLRMDADVARLCGCGHDPGRAGRLLRLRVAGAWRTGDGDPISRTAALETREEPMTSIVQSEATIPSPAGASRRLPRTVPVRTASDGAGVRLTRVIGGPALPDLDPFLLLDEFRSDDAADYLAGFPDHPHRGFETVTYMLAGRMRHGDNKGN